MELKCEQETAQLSSLSFCSGHVFSIESEVPLKPFRATTDISFILAVWLITTPSTRTVKYGVSSSPRLSLPVMVKVTQYSQDTE
jgi:hypothetical protein